MSKSKIEWTDVTVNPFPGCCKVSPGCENCYAERMAQRLKAMGQPQYQDVVDEHGWTGRSCCAGADVMRVPGRGKKVFVNSMGDLAYQEVPFPGFCRVMGHVMLQPWHTFQILTKRPSELAERIDRIIDAGTAARYLSPLMLLADAVATDYTEAQFAHANQWYKTNVDQSDRGICDLPVRWPLVNLWVGATCEDQPWYERRAQDLVECRAAVHFLSLEPFLGPIQLGWPRSKERTGEFFARRESLGIDWVIVGCESGPNRRPCDIRWVADIYEQCGAAGVPPLIKQIDIDGEVVHDAERIALELSGYVGRRLFVEDIRQFPAGSEEAV